MTKRTVNLPTEAGQTRMAVALERLAGQQQGSFESAQKAQASAEEAARQATASANSASQAAANAAAGITSITGDKAGLTTKNKTNLVAGINEVKGETTLHGKQLNKAMGDIEALKNGASAPAQFTLEGSTSPSFEVQNKQAADDYTHNMGGYLLRVIGGKVYAAKMMATDWTKFADGTTVDATKGETMVHVPKCHFKGNGKTLTFGGLTPVADGHYFDSPEWVGAYEMYVDGSGVGHSRPDVSPSHSRTMSAFDTAAKKNGSDWGQANYGFFCLINAVYQAKFGNLDSQSVIGTGGQTSSWDSWRNVNMGYTRSLGDGTGNAATSMSGQYSVKLFGFEDLWGKLWEFRPGIRFYMDNGTRYACVYGGNQVSNTADGRKFACLASASGEYAKTMQLGEHWDMICQSVGASSSTNYCDGYWASTGGELLFVGAYAYHGALCGVACASSYSAFSRSSADVGSRLAFYGQAEYVSGAELMAM